MANKLRVLVACEESQEVCKAFRALGHEAYSCDILPCSGGHPEWHIQDDVLKHLNDGWDLMIAHPPCTYLSTAGNRWKSEERDRKKEMAFEFFMKFINAPILKIAVENPQGYVNTHYRKPDQVIHPFHFGDNDKKRTCLWLKGLPRLLWNKHIGFVDSRKEPEPMHICQGEKCKGKKIYRTEGISGSQKRSKTFPGIAAAMAEQWGEQQQEGVSE